MDALLPANKFPLLPMIRRLLFPIAAILALTSDAAPLQAQPEPMILVGAHYDVNRRTPIGSAVYLAPIRSGLTLNGFLEVWQNNEQGFPANEPSLFSKHWLDYALTSRLNASLNLEILWNGAGVDFVWPTPMQFDPDEPARPYITPKLGFTYRVL